MAAPGSTAPGWYPDPDVAGRMRFWDGTAWMPPRGWYPDPENPRLERRWTGEAWGERRPRRFGLVVLGIVALLTLQGCATAITQAPTCNAHSPVSTPSSTPQALTWALWLVGVVGTVVLLGVWRGRGWAGSWIPAVLIPCAALLPVLGWAFFAASCGL